MDKLFTLLALQRQAQEAENAQALAHIITNETLKIVPYRQAVFWNAEGAAVSLKAVSGNVTLDDKGSYAQALTKLIKKHAFLAKSEEQEPENIRTFSPAGLNSEDGDFANPAAMVIFKTAQDGILGGLWLEREKGFKKAELQILSELAVTYSHALATVKLREGSLAKMLWGGIKKTRWFILTAVLIGLLCPVRLAITAPAEIVARSPSVVSAPFDGTLDKILVRPGDHVTAGQVIAEMDKINLGANLESAQQELSLARAGLARLRREALSSPEKKGELKKLEADIAIKAIEFSYAQAMIERSDIRSTQNGVAIFSDKNELQGKPIRMGEKIMMVADPKESELLVRVPVDAMIPIRSDASVKFFLNVAPLKSHSATIRSIGYQAGPDADGLLTYKIRARLGDDVQDMRIGWKGTGKIYGDRVIFGYALLRRPLVHLRELLGI